jgi:hypothetical protein
MGAGEGTIERHACATSEIVKVFFPRDKESVQAILLQQFASAIIPKVKLLFRKDHRS